MRAQPKIGALSVDDPAESMRSTAVFSEQTPSAQNATPRSGTAVNAQWSDQAPKLEWSEHDSPHLATQDPDHTDAMQVSCTDRFPPLIPPSVAASWPAIYVALLNGGSLHTLSPQRLRLSTSTSTEQISSRGITIHHSTLGEALPEGDCLDSGRSAALLATVCSGAMSIGANAHLPKK